MPGASPSFAPLLAGRILGKYKVLGHLGRGGMADVFVAMLRERDPDAVATDLVALKVLRDVLADDPEWVASFLDEARVSLQLEHANVVQTFAIGDLEGATAIVLEFLQGASLAELRRNHVQHETRMPLDIGLHALAEALAGLHYAHEKASSEGKPLHLIHRDFTPNNIFVTLEGRVKVLDFGLAKTTETSAKTSTGVVKGTVRYVAPEAILGIYVDRRVDLYAAGVALWELVSGERAWAGLSDVAVLNRVSMGATLSLCEAAPTADEALVRICDRAVAHARKDRFVSAREMRAAILEYVAEKDLVCDQTRFAAYVTAQVGDACRERAESFEAARHAASSPVVSSALAKADGSTMTRRLAPDSTNGATFTTSVSGRRDREHASEHAADVRRGRHRRWSMVGGAGLLLTGALVGLSLHHSEVPVSQITSTTRAAPPPPPAISSSRVVVSLRVPEGADVRAGEEMLASSNGVASVNRPPGLLEKIRVELRGHVSVERVVHFDAPHEETFTLERLATPGRPVALPRARPTSVASSAAAPPSSASSGSAPIPPAPRRIDENNPFDE